MDNSKEKYNALAMVLVFLGMITLGCLGNVAFKVNSFYWIPFFLNLGFYVVAIYKLFKKGMEV